jgi:L-asparaginase II
VTALVEVVRSGYVEGYHHASLLALRPDGSAALALGELDRPWFGRSSNKPLQAAVLLALGWAPASDVELALACASHSGEPGHLEVVRAILGELGPEALGCPPDLPLDEAAAHAVLRAGGAATALTMNCSGKHAAMLRTCVVNGWATQGYLDPAHPLQRALQAGLEELAGEPVLHVAVDGCGAPQHALTLGGLAGAYARLAREQHPVVRAMRTHPWHVGGSGRDVTRLMEGVAGLVAKDGAEGVFAAALPDGSAVALKVHDGAARARTPLLVAGLRALGVEAPVLEELATTPVLGGGRRVGDVRVAGPLAG